ncbi:MAG: protein translocase subunit SecD, partial [Flavisolibacter sp.]
MRESAGNAFDNTFRVLSTRIDQFGVAQPNINPDKERDIITVELPGVQDPERIRTILQSTANLQFWEVYKPEELLNAWVGAETAYNAIATGTLFTDSTGSANDTTGKADTGNTKITKSLFQDFKFNPQQGVVIATKDTGAFREVLNHPAIRRNFPNDLKFLYGIPNRDDNGKKLNIVPLYVIKTKGSDKPPIEGDVVTSASMRFEQGSNSPSVSMSMNPSGSAKWEKLTETSAKETRPIAIVLDDKVYSAPIAHNGKISGGQTSITGNFTVDEANDLANILEAGRLPAPAKIVADQVVGPTLGEDAIRGGVTAFVISFLVIFILMLVYYNTSGWIANIALILNLLFTIGVLTGLGATLTAPGIAGLVLTIGMAVDTNVIIYERIKEELTNGKSYIQAVNEGYRRSLPPVLDAHVTTLLTAIILFSFGLGPVKGFATTQIIGILLSLFCGILVSRWVTDWFTNKKRHLEYFTPISKRIFKHASYKFI